MTAMYRVTVLTLFMWTSKAAEISEITVKSGADATLSCQSPRDVNITLLEWIRSNLTDKYVFFFRDGRPYDQFQLPSFRGRVQLMDPQMKNGNVSVILKNVNINDTGTYECRVSVRGKEPDLISIIDLKVEVSGEGDEGLTSGGLGLLEGLTVVGVIVAVAAVCLIFMIYRRRKKLPPPPAGSADHQLI